MVADVSSTWRSSQRRSQVPGRKTDVKDAEWICQLAEAGLLKASFVPPKPIRALRNLTRYRKTQIQERSREANRLHKALEDTGIKLDCVASDILGVSGRLMLDALVAGTSREHAVSEAHRCPGRQRGWWPAQATHSPVVHAASLKAAITQLRDLTKANASRSSQEALVANLVLLRAYGVDDEILDLVVEMALAQNLDEETTAAVNYLASGFLLALLALREEGIFRSFHPGKDR
jgi:hypothetical protein